ncbi:calcium-binding protein [Streptomyces sp. NPDC051018]|uniref:calcium-binding protein n=1 Tax=Streptomyces sp. NPDC051018 TaxID=3365639 RepID=UPI0037BD1707
MRFRASAVAVTTGVLALTTLAAPAVQADETPRPDRAAAEKLRADAVAEARAKQRSGASAKARIAANPNPTISNVIVNGGKPLVVGLADKKFTVTFKATSPSGIQEGFAIPWAGTNPDTTDAFFLADEFYAKNCTGAAPVCRSDYTVIPWLDLENRWAGTWKTQIGALSGDALGATVIDNAKSFSVLRDTRLTVNAAPEPVKKNKTLTITGTQRIVNWDRETYSGYSGQSVVLEFRKKGAKAYSRVKTVKTDAKGNLKTTVKATTDGYWRYNYKGAPGIAPVLTAGDFVDVR